MNTAYGMSPSFFAWAAADAVSGRLWARSAGGRAIGSRLASVGGQGLAGGASSHQVMVQVVVVTIVTVRLMMRRMAFLSAVTVLGNGLSNMIFLTNLRGRRTIFLAKPFDGL